MYTIITQELLYEHQIAHYQERLKHERAKPDSEEKIKAIAFLRQQHHFLKLAKAALYN